MVGARSSRKDCMAHRYASTVLPRREKLCVSSAPDGFALLALFGRSPTKVFCTGPSHPHRNSLRRHFEVGSSEQCGAHISWAHS